MKNIVIIGGTKGIGKSIVSEVVENHKVVCLSRNQTDFSHDNYTFHNFDALVDDYPDLDSVDCLADAYEEIKTRKGKMVDGLFVKDE